MGVLDTAKKSITAVREKTGSVILFCSFGKDSIVLLDLLCGHFEKVTVVFMYFVSGLEHIDHWIRWAESRYKNIEILQVPHWNLSYILRSGMYCVPNRNVRLIKLRDVIDAIRMRTGIHYVFLGMKKADGMNRRLMLKGYSENNYENNGMVYPLADWTQKDILAYMRQRNLPEPVRYSLKASSGVGFNLDCFLWMERNFPDDLKRIYKVFPMSERILWEYHQKEGGAKGQ